MDPVTKEDGSRKMKEIRGWEDFTGCYHLNRREWIGPARGLPFPVAPNGGGANRFLSTFNGSANDLGEAWNEQGEKKAGGVKNHKSRQVRKRGVDPGAPSQTEYRVSFRKPVPDPPN